VKVACKSFSFSQAYHYFDSYFCQILAALH
jgi:hypothetical protein